MNEVTWQTDPGFIGANHAVRACIGVYELVVFDLPADRAGRAVVGWELPTAPPGIDRAWRSADIRRR